MTLPTIFNVATPTIAAALIASGEITGFNKHVSRKFFRWLLSCPYRAHRRLYRQQHTITVPLKTRKKDFGWQVRTLENIWIQLGERASQVFDAVKKVQDPLSGLCLDRENQIALNVILNCCQFNRPVPFFIGVPFWKQAYVRKIAEGAYGEVYSTVNSAKEPRILKFVPVHGSSPTNHHISNITFKQILPDVVCSKYLSELNEGGEFKAPNFPILYSLNLVKGKFPNVITKAWRNYEIGFERQDDSSATVNPDLYSDQQFYVIIEMQDCGRPMSMPPVNEILACVSCICQAASALAVAEKAFEFEHRDLHLANILLQKTKQKSLEYILEGKPFEIMTYGFQLFIIDFTMSRITINGTIYKMEIDHREYHPIHISEIGEEFEWTNHLLLYRLLSAVCNNNWSTFNPITNIYWLRYVIENLLRILVESRRSPEITMDEREALLRLDSWRDELLQCNSATMFLRDVLLDHCPFVKSI